MPGDASTSGPLMLQAVPVLPARDIEATLDYFGTKLGFREVFRIGEPANYAGVQRDGVLLHFYVSSDAKLFEWASCRIRVSGVEQLYAEFQAQGVIHPNGALEIKPWGSQEFSVLTSDGVCLAFAESASA